MSLFPYANSIQHDELILQLTKLDNIFTEIKSQFIIIYYAEKPKETSLLVAKIAETILRNIEKYPSKETFSHGIKQAQATLDFLCSIVLQQPPILFFTKSEDEQRFDVVTENIKKHLRVEHAAHAIKLEKVINTFFAD